MEAVVVDTTANSIVVEDLTGDLSTVQWTVERAEFCGAGSLTAAGPIAGFVPSRGSTGASLRSVSLRSIFAFNDSKQANAPTYQTHGTWTSAPSYASSQTTFTDIDADDNGGGFASWMIGSILVPDVNIGAPLIITGATATTLTVAGDVETVRWTVERAELCGAGSSGVASSGSQYIVYAAPFTDSVRGTWQTDPHKGGTRYLWAGYRYQPSQMGFWVDPPGTAGLGVYGAATGTNRLGQYYCWNRTYDVNIGRWTAPDPVAMPFFNLVDYAGCKPVSRNDPSGLVAIFIHGAFGGSHGEGINKMAKEHQDDGGSSVTFRDYDFDKIVAFICDLKCADPDEPICLIGYSWGGATAVKVAQHFAEHKCLCQTGSRWYPIEDCGNGGVWIPEYEERRVEIRYIALIDAVFSWTNIDERYRHNYITSYRVFWANPNIFWLGLLWGAWPGVPSYMRLPWYAIKWTDHLAIVHNRDVQDQIRKDLKYYDKHKRLVQFQK